MASHPPLPDGFVLDGAPATGAPPLPEGFVPDGQANDDAPVYQAPTAVAFNDELPDQSTYQLSPEDQSAYVALARHPSTTADDIRQFFAKRGLTATNADEVVKARDEGRGVNDYVPAPALPKPEGGTSTGGSLVRGIVQGGTLGFGDELAGAVDAGKALLHGGDPAAAYNDTVDIERGKLAADQEQHPYASIAGNLYGGAFLPYAGEESGLVRAFPEVARDAYKSARLEGFSQEEARQVAKQTVAWRLSKEGAGYGAAYGVGSSNGGPGERLLGGAEGTVVGAALPFAGRAIAPVVRPVLDAGVSGVNRVAGAGRALLRPVTQEGALDQASDVLKGAVTRPLADILSDIRNAPEPVEGVSPTLAEVAGDPGIAGVQRGHANTDPNTAAALGERNAANALARTKAASETLGDGTAQAVQDYAGNQLSAAEQTTTNQQADRAASVTARLADVHAKATQARTDAQQHLSMAIEALGPTADRDATGSAARTAFDDAYQAAKAKTSEAYADPVLKQATPINLPDSLFGKLRQGLDDFYGHGGGEVKAALSSILDDMAAPDATTRTLTNIDRRLADFAGSARMAGRNSEAAFADGVRRNLGDAALEVATPEYRAALANAKAVRAEQGRVFETGDTSATFARDRYGNPVVGDNTVPTKLLRPGAPGGDTAERLIQAIGPQQAENVVRQEVRRVADGVQTEAQARALTARYAEAARRFPTVQRDLDNVQSRASALDAAHIVERDAAAGRPSADEAASIAEKSALHASILKSPLARIADPTQDATAFIKRLLGKDDGGRQLRFLGNQVNGDLEARNGLRRALGDYIVEAGKGPNFTASGDQIPSVNKTRAAIAKVLNRAGDMLTPQQRIVLKTVARELETTNFANTASKPAGSETAINKTFTQMIASHVLPAKARLLIHTVISALGNGAEVKKLITQAILDPEFAATLLKRPTERHWMQVRSGLAGRKTAASGIAIGETFAAPYLKRVPSLAAQPQAQQGNGGSRN